MLAYNPEDRISAREALKEPYFRSLREREKRVQKAYALNTMRPNIMMGVGEIAGTTKNMYSSPSFYLIGTILLCQIRITCPTTYLLHISIRKMGIMTSVLIF